MIVFDEQLQKEYKKKDFIFGLLRSVEQPEDTQFTSHQWLLNSLPKRMIYYYVYADLFESAAKRRRILDVGGGYTALTRILLKNHDYYTLDIMAHDNPKCLKALEASLRKTFWIKADWYEFDDTGGYDLVIANDLFPNVDQRLTLFLDKYLPNCREMRISLTYHNTPCWYKVKRTDADEVFHLVPWDGWNLKHILKDFTDQIHRPDLDLLLQNPRSLFSNERQVCLVTFRGEGSF